MLRLPGESRLIRLRGTAVVEVLVAARTRIDRSPLRTLTPRGQEVLTLVARGHSNGAIAEELVLTRRAVEKHINAIFRKLGLPDETQVSRRVSATLIYLSKD